MKRFFLLLCLVLGAAAARAQAAPNFAVGYIETTTSRTIGGQRIKIQNLKFTDLKILGTWIWEDKDGQHGYIYVDDAQEAKWENTDLVVALGVQMFEVNRMQRWKTGETALIIDDLDDESATLLRQSNAHAPWDDQIEARWQPLNGAQVQLTVSNRGTQTLRLAPSVEQGAQANFTFTRDGKPLAPLATNNANAQANTNETQFGSLEAGAQWKRTFDLNQFADVSQPGHYQVDVRYQLPVQNGDSPGASPKESVLLKFNDKFEFDVAAK